MIIRPTPIALALSRAYGSIRPHTLSSLRVVPCGACNGGALRRMTACPRCNGAGKLLSC